MTESKQDYIDALQSKVDKINQRKSKPAKVKRTIVVLLRRNVLDMLLI